MQIHTPYHNLSFAIFLLAIAITLCPSVCPSVRPASYSKMAATAASLIFYDDYSSGTKTGRDMGFSTKGLVSVGGPPVLNLKCYDIQNGGYIWRHT